MDPAIMFSEDEEENCGQKTEILELQREFTFWVFIKSSNRAADDWKPKPIANFKTVQEFWSVY